VAVPGEFACHLGDPGLVVVDLGAMRGTHRSSNAASAVRRSIGSFITRTS
jgi:hypothetical protein